MTTMASRTGKRATVKAVAAKPARAKGVKKVGQKAGKKVATAKRRDDGKSVVSAKCGLNSRQLSAISAAREVFWHDVLREMLISLAMRYEERSRLSAVVPPGGALTGPGIPDAEDMFDGRIAVINSQGHRIPIAAIVPVFSMGFGRTPDERALSSAVESTIFQIKTPSGEVFTLPVSEIRSFHAMSEELIQSLERASREAAAGDDTQDEAAGPFGFAAFTSLSKGAADVPFFAPPGATPPDEGYLPG